MRKKRLKRNTVSSLIFQFTSIICGFILPRLILKRYGSEVNGLVHSIAQFLQLIAFLELGVGAVVQSALYKPLAEKDNPQISRIIHSASLFFRRLAVVLLIYVLCLVLLYPRLSSSSFGFTYTAFLILAMSVSSFAQYYFGVVDRLLLTADQRGYIQYTAQTCTLIVNTIACAILIELGASIQVVKLTTSVIYLVRPLFLRLYVQRHYSIDRKIVYHTEPITQKWNGVAQHVAAIVLDGTDVIVLTALSSLSNVSIYSVYHMVVHGIKQLFMSITNGIQSLVGELWAKNELDELDRLFEIVEWAIHTGVDYIFGCTCVLLLPFINVYTRGVSDTNYLLPAFSLLITLANAGHCLRLPYNIMILAVGHYKQTQKNYIIAALINIVLSIIFVRTWGLIGVALGTLAAMLYQTIWMAIYCYRQLLYKGKQRRFWKHLLTDFIYFSAAAAYSTTVRLRTLSYLSWLLLAFKSAVILAIFLILINLLLNRDKFRILYARFR